VERLLLAQHPDLLATADPRPTGGAQAQGSAMPLANPDRTPAVAAGARGTLAVRRGRLLAGIGMAVAAVLFGAGALRTSHQAGTDHMAGSVGLAMCGALLVALVAAVMVAQLRASVEQRKVPCSGTG